ncbi:MAG TPA: carbohydrate-binding family 9-like protein [Pyrinomonadaceae bacterium]|nr:carbohydrate-binding family 9-like protein [Pyrinomonadaceae bacterium]
MSGSEVIQAPFVRAVGVAQFDAAEWDQCEPLMIAHLWSGAPAPVERHAEVRICWSDEALHVRFVCNQHEPLVVSAEPKTDRKTLGLWERDVCEIFVAPNPATPERYFEFEGAPTGEWVDLGILVLPNGRETDWEYRSGMKAAANVSEKEVEIGIAIPWSESIPKPDRGDVWLVNLFRCIGPEGPDRYLAWRPTYTPEPAFHVPKAFGELRFR